MFLANSHSSTGKYTWYPSVECLHWSVHFYTLGSKEAKVRQRWNEVISMRAQSLQSCLTLCDPIDYSPLGSSVHGLLQASILDWVAVPSSRGSSQFRDGTSISFVSCIGRWVLYHWHHLGSPKSLHHVWPCNPMNCSLPGKCVNRETGRTWELK